MEERPFYWSFARAGDWPKGGEKSGASKVMVKMGSRLRCGERESKWWAVDHICGQRTKGQKADKKSF